MSLAIETKKAMGYSAGDSVCKNCSYHKEVEDMMVDRSWHSVCTYSSLCNFTVVKEGSCQKFELRFELRQK